RLTGELEEATRVYQKMLELDSDDFSGAHYGLIGLLLLNREYHQARALIDQYQEDEDPALAWANALVQYAVLGAKAARRELEDAIEDAPLVASCLLNPDTLDDLDFSSMEGHCAFVAIESFSEAWQECPGAIDWLSKFVYGGKKN
ncbi:MAG: hypothetical protein IT364_19970, partial [Candidatus Hydrogenedentes bacterium]|nr:hypothetical protein [Candidatus Hydrogenedentota bacterium]